MADENNKIIDLETLSHFKAKQDLANEQKFKRKDDASDLKGAVRYDAAQALTEQEKAQARMNIGAAAPGEGGGGGGSIEGAVRYDVEQALDDEAKARARANIGTTDGTWANIPDKPFGEGGKTVIEMPSDTSGSMIISSQSLEALGGIAFSFVKVGNKLNSADEIHGAEVSVTANGSVIDFVVNSSHITDVGNGFVILYTEGAFLPACLNITSAGAATIPTQDMLGEDLIINATEEGLYFVYVEGLGQTDSIRLNIIKRLERQYLPTDIVYANSNGQIPAEMLPSYVDDVVEGVYCEEDEAAGTEEHFSDHNGKDIEPESGKIYVDLNTGNTYRWSGSTYVRMNPDEYTLATTSDIDALFT